MLEREPNRYDELKKIHEEALAQAKQEVAREQHDRLRVGTATNDAEAHMAAFEKELDAREKIGQITRPEKIDLLRREENRVVTEVQRGVVEFPEPKIDPERMLNEPKYREEVYRKERQARQLARNGAREKQGLQHDDSDGR